MLFLLFKIFTNALKINKNAFFLPCVTDLYLFSFMPCSNRSIINFLYTTQYSFSFLPCTNKSTLYFFTTKLQLYNNFPVYHTVTDVEYFSFTPCSTRFTIVSLPLCKISLPVINIDVDLINHSFQ